MNNCYGNVAIAHSAESAQYAMPIVKVPVQHKFGIVSLSQAEHLLAEKKQKPRVRLPRHTKTSEINPEFVAKYNATPEFEREKLDGVLTRALLHAKFKAGLHPASSPSPQPTTSPSTSPSHGLTDTPPPDVSSAWLELTILCQCCGPHQEEVMVTLATSLNHAPISTAHIPSLIYIASLCYQWLKSDLMVEKMLRAGELLLLRILYLVSLRLFHHHLTGALQDACTREEIRQLKFDLEGFENREKAYRDFPEALLHWKVALEVGLLACEGYSRPLHDPSVLSRSPEGSSERGDQHSPTAGEQETPKTAGSSGCSGYSGRALSSILWHSLDVWQCMRLGFPSLREATEDLLSCSTDFDTAENWIEGMLAMDVLCAASQVNITVLHLVQSLAKGLPKPQHGTDDEDQEQNHQEQRRLGELQSPPRADHEVHMAGPDLGVGAGVVADQGNRLLPSHRRVATRFKLPGSERGSSVNSRRVPPESSGGSRKMQVKGTAQRRVATLNILGMQPAFQEPYPESMATTVQQTIVESESAERTTTKSTEIQDDFEEGNGGVRHYPQLQFKEGFGMDYPYLTESLDSVHTQSLIENESIPDILPSGSSTNTSVDLSQSITSLDSNKSAEILAISSPGLKSGTSKTLAFGIIVSTPGLITESSQEIKSRTSKTPEHGSTAGLRITGLESGASKALELGQASTLYEASEEEILSGTGTSEGKAEEGTTDARSTGRRKSREKRVSLDDGVSLPAELGTRVPLVGPTPIEEMLETSLDEAIDRVGLLDDRFQYFRPQQQGKQLGFSGRSVTLSLPRRNIETRCTHYTHSTAALSGAGGVPGSQVPPSTIYKHSVYSIPLTIESENRESAVFGNVPKFENWPSEVALAYTLNMASIVIYGRTSLIQKMALEGLDAKDARQCALLQLSEFANESPASKCDFSSWAIRHAAVLGLSRVCRVCRQLPVRDGLSGVAWGRLVERQSTERDARVLEAYRLTQACVDLDGPLLAVDAQPFSSPLVAHIADSLIRLFLPTDTPTPDVKPPANIKSPRRPPVQPKNKSPAKADKEKKDIRAKVDSQPRRKGATLPADFITRTTGALSRIAEEHWRRQMREEEEQLEEEQHRERERLQQEHEERMKRKAEKLARRRPRPKDDSYH